MVMMISVGNVWATTYKLTKVTSVEAGKLYVFERNSHVFNNTCASSALQTTASYNTTGLEGTESYVWTLETATSGYYLKNVSLSTNPYLANASKTTVSFAATGSKWTITFSGEVAIIQNLDNGNRFLGDAGKTSPNNTYKAYATSNLSDYEHDITVYVLEEEGGVTPPTPAKTLESVAVSGNPTKTSYTAGEDFDPAGLTVTGTYSDESTAPITSGITWSYDPSQELALNQSSIGVIATVSEIASPKFNVTGLTVTAPVVSNWQVTAPADLETGDVVVLTMNVGGTYYAAANNNGTSNAPAATEVAVVNSKLSNFPGETLQWTVTVDESGYQFAVGDNNLYCTNTNNGVRVGTNDNKVFTVAESNSKYYLLNSATTRYLGVYNNQDWRCYTSVNSNINAGSLVIFREPASSKQAAGLAFETTAYLVKANGSLATPTLSTAEGFDGTVTYASSDENVAAVDGSTGALTIKAAGKAVITASSEETDTYKAGSASYIIYVAEQAGTAEDPLTEASAKALIDLGCTLNAHVNGIVLSQNSTNFTVTLTDGFQFYKAKDLNNVAFESAYLGAGDEVTAVGSLKKYNSTYELDEGCYLTYYEQATTPLTPIANDKDHPYTVAQALAFAAAPTTYDLSDHVYIQGVVYKANSFDENNGTYNIYIKDAGTSENDGKFEFYKCSGLYQVGETAVPFEEGDVQVGNIVIGYGVMTYYSQNSIWEFGQPNQLVDLQKPVTGVQLDQTEASVEEEATVTLTATILPSNATGTIVWSVESGSDKASVENGVVTGIAEGTAVVRATVQGTTIYAECTVTVTAKSAPDTRKVANSPAEFEAVSGDMTPADITFASYKGGAGTDPFITSGKAIRLYQISGSNTFGGYITLSAVAGCTIDEVQITTTSSYSTTVAYSKDGNENLLGSENVAASSSYTTGTGLNVSSVNILNMGTGSSGRLEIASIKVYYTGEAATIDHYELGGTYATEFEVGDDFNHNGLIVYAAYDALGENKVDITSSCTFSDPDMSTEGQMTIDITYKEEVVKNYTITVNASTDTRKVAESPATFMAVSGDMTPADITFASYKGGAGNDPYLATTGIRLYQISGSNDFGGFITLTAKKGCTIDQVKITTSDSYATTVAYSVDGNENLLGSESVAKSGDYTTPAGLNVESVNILNLGTGSSGRLEIASIKVWYTGDALSVDHYILGGSYATEFEQYGEFNFEGLTVTAAYDELETITEAVTGFTVEADLNTAGAAKANVMLNSVKIAEYDITVTASAKTDPALAYSPASVILTLGDALSAPTFSNTYNVSPITYSSDKKSVATVDAEGNIALAGGCGTAVITASFAGDDDYIDSEATFTITVNEPAEDLSGTWVVAKSVAVGDRIIVGATVSAGTKTMGKQNSNPNRAAVASTLADGVLTPGEGTKTFLVVDAGNGKFALQALNGKYLTSATSGTGNNLLEAADYENDNAKWTITIDGEGVASVVAAAGSRTYMQYNNGSTLFSCYQNATSQSPINIYKIGTPEYGSYNRDGLTVDNYGTICLPKAGTIEGATLFDLEYYDGASTLYLLEVNGNAMVAGRPYIFLPSATSIEVTYTSNASEDAGNYNGLVGSYTQETITPNAGNYILYQNAYYLVNSEAYVGANRAYIHMEDVPDQPTPQVGQAPRRRVAMNVNGTNGATGFENINATEKPMKLMLNGQIYILRGEKMYDATGRLVK